MLFEDRLEGAEKIISRINYSYAFRERYIKLLSGQELSTSDRVTIIQELRSVFAWTGLWILKMWCFSSITALWPFQPLEW